tara:strand:+ start:424 stop:987 length:564 start_codon:yes stop_codon:yes gene_type:complete
MLFVYAELSKWSQGPFVRSCEAPTITFSELKQENDNGIYVTEVLEIEDEGSCNLQYGLRWAYIDLYLMNDEDLTYDMAVGTDIIDNYSGNNTFYWTQKELSFERNISAQISNDNGTEFPIHIQNEMTDPKEDYNHSAKYPRYSLTISVGDKIKIYGSGSDAEGPAREGWSLKIRYVTGETVSEIKIA